MKNFFVLMILALLLGACTAPEQPEPPEQALPQYQQAYWQLQEADSFVLERVDSYAYGSSDAEVETTAGEQTWQVVRADEGDMAIASIGITYMGETQSAVDIYCRNGYSYQREQYVDEDTMEQQYRYPRDDDFVMRVALSGVLDLPAEVVAKQSASDSADGRLLTFELDSAEYYAFAYAETAAEYPYGEAFSFREPPLYTVLLDDEGRIKQVSGSSCTVNADAAANTWEQSYTITFTQYGGVELDFSQLNEEDYPELEYGPAL